MKAISKTPFIEAVRTWDAKQVAGTLHERPEFVSILDDAGRTLLHNCARRPISNENNSAASIATANVLLKAGVPIDAVEAIKDDGEIFPATALWYALAWGRNRPLASFLLKAGADPSHCMFALVYADDLASAKLVRRYGAEVDEVFGGETPLIYAMRHQRAKFSEWLLKEGANPNARDRRGLSAMHHAVRRRLSGIDAESIAQSRSGHRCGRGRWYVSRSTCDTSAAGAPPNRCRPYEANCG